MAIAEPNSGSSSISTTEFSLVNGSTSLASDATDGIYQIYIDLNALAAGDVYELRVKEKTRSASTQRVVISATFSGAQADPVFATPSMLMIHGWDVTLRKIAGTDRTIEWSIRRVT